MKLIYEILTRKIHCLIAGHVWFSPEGSRYSYCTRCGFYVYSLTPKMSVRFPHVTRKEPDAAPKYSTTMRFKKGVK